MMRFSKLSEIIHSRDIINSIKTFVISIDTIVTLQILCYLVSSFVDVLDEDNVFLFLVSCLREKFREFLLTV
jgi:hypothetical protein